jgi:exodeoxyribonuclease VII large subunit
MRLKKNNLPEEKDLFLKGPGPSLKKHIYSVTEITQRLKSILQDSLGEVWVEGEVSGARRIPTGTVFFSLKDDASILRCVIFGSNLEKIKFELKDGIRVLCLGQISIYEKRGDYQLYVQKIEPKGIGSLQMALEQLKLKLEKEGLFSPGHKRPIPYLPKKIGVVTSLGGAALKDILKVLERRFSGAHIIISPAQVQGEGAKEEIAQAISNFNCLNDRLAKEERVEVLIVGRGGGSIEDLWAFNEEIVARAIYHSKVPIISAVGHERDWTIADLVADLRAPTPSVAAELVIPRIEDLRDKLDDLRRALNKFLADSLLDFQEAADDCLRRMAQAIEGTFRLSLSELQSAQKKLSLLNPLLLLKQYKIKVADLGRQISLRTEYLLKLKETCLNVLVEKLSSLSPLNVLSRGYSITFKLPEGTLAKDARLLKAGDMLNTKLEKGQILSKVTEVG